MASDAPQTNGTSTRRARKACTQCRQQKARCDVDVVQPCSRCSKIQAECVISDSFEREHKRRKLYQLQNETDQLRRQLNNRASTTPKSTGVRGSTSGEEYGVLRDHESNTPNAVDRPDEVDNRTLPRTIDGLVVSAIEIDKFFRIYFKDYAPLLPILNPLQSPNRYYDDSPLLFWLIVVTATRCQSVDTNLTQELRPRIVDLVLTTIKLSASEQNIQALLLQLTWPFPSSQRSLDLTFMLDGLMFHMAMQMGLHTARNLQEFSKVELNLSEEDYRRTAVLWAHCLLMHQSIVCLKGAPAIALEDITLDPETRQQFLNSLPDDLRAQVQLQDLLRCCCTTLGKLGLQSLSAEREALVDVLIAGFEQQLAAVQLPQEMTAVTEIRLIIAEMQVVAFHLYKDPETLAGQPSILAKLYTKAARFVDKLQDLITSGVYASSAIPLYFQHGLISASCILLRLTKSPALRVVAYEETAELITKKAVELAQGLSLEQSDLPSRTSIITGQLLTSKKAFIHPDTLGKGIEPQSVPLRAKGRLMASHILDTGAWWREEFHGRTDDPYPMKNFGPTNTVLKPIERQLNNDTQNLTTTNPPSQELQMLNTTNGPVPSDPFTPGAFGQFLDDDLSLDLWGAWPMTEGWGIPGLT